MCRKGLFTVLLMFVGLFSFGQKTSSKPAKSSQYIMHVVKFGENLTKIAQKYGVSKTDILKANPSLTPDNLNPEQILRIPVTAGNKNTTALQTKDNESIAKVKVDNSIPAKSGKSHVVEKGQTLYAISKMYGVKVEDLQKWNQLKDAAVKIGMELLVSDPAAKPASKLSTGDLPAKTSETVNNESIKPGTVPSDVKKGPVLASDDIETENMQDIEKPDVQAADNESQKELAALFKSKSAGASIQKSKGTGAPMTTTLGAMENVYFAMHKTLPIGTIIKVKNLVNSKIIYAKVIGKLPETDENKHVIVRYSLGVKKDLQLQNGKCYVQIEYPN